jgi:hypothetical protein
MSYGYRVVKEELRLDTGYRIPDTRYRIQDTGCGYLSIEY